MASQGMGVYGAGEHRDGQGRLIWGGHTRGKWWLYFFGDWDVWRSNYCEQHRNDRLSQSFRKGDIRIKSIITTLCLKVVEKCS